MDEDLRRTSFGVWRFGLAYLHGAIALDEADPNPWVACNVTHQCFCQSIELGFKSFLLAKGWTVENIESLGHSLVESMNAAVDEGFPPLPQAQVVVVMDHHYKGNEYRFIVTGECDDVHPTALSAVCEGILHHAASEIAIAMGDPAKASTMRAQLLASVHQGKTGATHQYP